MGLRTIDVTLMHQIRAAVLRSISVLGCGNGVELSLAGARSLSRGNSRPGHLFGTIILVQILTIAF